MRTIGNHVETALLRVVAAVAGVSNVDRQKPIMTIEEIRSSDWASATFVGSIHEFDLRFEGTTGAVNTAMDALASGLAKREIALSGQIVAEIGMLPGDKKVIGEDMISKTLTVNALVIRD